MRKQGAARHLVTPRTLLFLERDGLCLFLEGAAHKWFAGLRNGVGGSVEPGEDVRSAALREAEEETGLAPVDVELAAISHVVADPPVLLFVFTGRLPAGDLRPTPEGTFVWLTRDEALDAARARLVPDLPVLLPQIWSRPPGAPPLYLAAS